MPAQTDPPPSIALAILSHGVDLPAEYGTAWNPEWIDMPERHVPYDDFVRRPVDDMRRRAADFLGDMQRRRSIRHFSGEPLPMDVVENCLRTAGSGPSGADRQPWQFVVVTDPHTKALLRHGAEREERRFYENRSQSEWHDALRILRTNHSKPFLTEAPVVIAVFAKPFEIDAGGGRSRNYYVRESVGIATGLLIASLHHCGIATLTYTPSQMGFLAELLRRPSNERPFILVVAGYPAPETRVPPEVGTKKDLNEIATFITGQTSGDG